jgi:hypothetical protein
MQLQLGLGIGERRTVIKGWSRGEFSAQSGNYELRTFTRDPE